MKYQIIEFNLDKKLSKKAVDDIFLILKQEGARRIELRFTNVKHNDFNKAVKNIVKLSKEELEEYG